MVVLRWRVERWRAAISVFLHFGIFFRLVSICNENRWSHIHLGFGFDLDFVLAFFYSFRFGCLWSITEFIIWILLIWVQICKRSLNFCKGGANALKLNEVKACCPLTYFYVLWLEKNRQSKVDLPWKLHCQNLIHHENPTICVLLFL